MFSYQGVTFVRREFGKTQLKVALYDRSAHAAKSVREPAEAAADSKCH